MTSQSSPVQTSHVPIVALSLFPLQFPVEVSDPKGDDSLRMTSIYQAEDRGSFSVTKLIVKSSQLLLPVIDWTCRDIETPRALITLGTKASGSICVAAFSSDSAPRSLQHSVT